MLIFRDSYAKSANFLLHTSALYKDGHDDGQLTTQAALYSSSQFSSSGPRAVFSLTNTVGSSCEVGRDSDHHDDNGVDGNDGGAGDDSGDGRNLRYIILLLVLNHVNQVSHPSAQV